MSLPGIIKKLDETVVNRIAAGEVIQRPANALKELLENSLDAQSTNIGVTLKSGGLKLLQIQDNGTGIRKENLDIVCERFTTSKLRQFEDLNCIATFGFRGEALASISHVAHLTITTKTADEPCAFKAAYEDGKLKGSPNPCARDKGTLISVEDLFYNIPTRKKSFKSPSIEHAKVLDVITKYSIHNPKVGFSLKKHGENVSDVKTNSGSTHIDNIKQIYGVNVARELLEVIHKDEMFKFNLHGYVSNANYSTKKRIFILFINHRLVDSQGLRKAIDGVYSLYLPKGTYPFIYLSLEIDPRNVDVNVHPTKHEVHFLHEDSIIENTKKAIEEKLLGANTSRVFYTQAKLPGVSDMELTSAVLEKSVSTQQKNMIRTDSSSQKLDKFLTPVTKELTDLTEREISLPLRSNSHHRREIKLTSVLSLRKQVETECNIALRDIFANHIYVGCADVNKAFFQHNVSLYILDCKKIREELFYQYMLYEFGNFGAVKFKTPLPVKQILIMGIKDPQAGWEESDGEPEELSDNMVKLLSSKKAMLQDYFAVEIDENDLLHSIPLLLDGYRPDMSYLPLYMVRLACEVDWSAELPCFTSICRETAKFYCNMSETELIDNHDWEWVMEHIVFPAVKSTFLPPKLISDDRHMCMVATLPELYKVFERC